MSIRRSPHLLPAAACVAVLAARPAAAQVQDLTTFTRNGSATLSGSTLVLTPATTSQSGSAFRATPIATAGLQSLTASFTYTIGGGSGADGIAFILQGNGPTALGDGGGGIGYGGVTNSLAALLRTYTFNVVQVGTNGAFTGSSAAASLRGTHDVTVNYVTGTQLFSVLLDGTAVVSQTGVDLAGLVGPQAYVGFASGTGAGTDMHQINRFSLTTVYASTSAVPEPATLALTGAGLLAVGAAATRRRARA